MFYEEKQLNENLACPRCLERYDEPKMLPCANVICQRCVLSIRNAVSKRDTKFVCPMCKGKHEFPKKNESFPTCKQISNFLAQSPMQVYRGEQVEALKSNMNIVFNKLNRYQAFEPTDALHKHCNQLRAQLGESLSATLQFVNELNESLLNKINTYEQECAAKLKNNVDSQLRMEAKAAEIKEFLAKWECYIKQPQIDDKEVAIGNDTSIQMQADLDKEMSSLKQEAFNGEVLQFKKPLIADKNLLGSLEFANAQVVHLVVKEFEGKLKYFIFVNFHFEYDKSL